MSQRLCTFLAAALCLVTAPAARAEEPHGAGALSRLEVLRLGQERSFDLRSKALDQHRAEALAGAARQPYAPTLFATTTASTTPAPPGGVDERRLDSALGASWRSAWGTQLSGQVEMDQALPGSGDGVHLSSLSLSLTQSLLKDGWVAGASLPLIEARLAAAIQLEVFRGQRNGFLVDLETAYWDLCLAQADLAVKLRSRERAQQQADDTAENIKRGILAETEAYLVQENVVIFDQDLIRARQDLANAQRHLAELLVLAPGEPLAAADELRAPTEPLPAADGAVTAALEAHPRVLERRLRLQLAEARRAFWANQTLPSLGLTGALALRGQDSVYGSAWGQLFTRPLPEARVGLLLSVPLDRPAVQAALERAQIDVEQAKAELRRTEESVRFEVQNAHAELATNLRLLSLAQRQVELAELKLKAQVDKYQSGLSTLADVVRFQRDVDNALSAAQRVVRSTRVGQARLAAATGALGERREGEPRALTMAEVHLELRGITKTYRRDQSEVPVLHGVDLVVERGERVAVMGRSGSGKSTLLHILGCLDLPTSGSYHLAGRDVSRVSDDELSRIRNETFGFVFQAFHLLKGLTIVENVELPMEYGALPEPKQRRRALELLALVGLSHRVDHRPSELSGGERQRVAIARSLANQPQILLADEPTGALDTRAQEAILELFTTIHRTLGTTMIVVTHDARVAQDLGRRTIRISDGRVEA